jgi:hypothetical protein
MMGLEKDIKERRRDDGEEADMCGEDRGGAAWAGEGF